MSFGLNLASVAILVLSESNRAVLPRYSCEVFPAPTRETFAPVAWQLIAAFLVPAIVGGAGGVAAVGGFIFAEAYWPSFFLTGVLLVGQAAYGLYLIPMNYLTQTAGLPKFSSLASGSGAVLILVSILLLAPPRYGAEGVAYATRRGGTRRWRLWPSYFRRCTSSTLRGDRGRRTGLESHSLRERS